MNTYDVKSIDEFVLPQALKNKVVTIIKSAKKRETLPDHMLLYGLPGTGKTTLARLIAKEFNVALITFEGAMLNSADKLTQLVNIIEPGAVLFIDEIHSSNSKVLEILYNIMEDNFLWLNETTKFLLAPLCVIGATTQIQDIPKPLYTRFIYKIPFPVYKEEELTQIIKQMVKAFKLSITDNATKIISKISKGTPRMARTHIQLLKDYAVIKDIPEITETDVQSYAKEYKIDLNLGLSATDIAILKSIGEYNTISARTLAIKNNLTEEEYLKNYEIFLIQEGYIDITRTGRMLTDKGKEVAYGQRNGNI